MTGFMTIEGFNAVISYSEDMEMLRGEFIGLNGYADFYAEDLAGLQREGKISLDVFLESCVAGGTEPRRHYSGKFPVRATPELHETIHLAAIKSGAKSVNAWIIDALKKEAEETIGG